jgi:DNA primase small subunit
MCGTHVAARARVQNGRDLQNALKEKVPTKIDIGPVYSQDPAKRAAYTGDTSATGFKPLERELVFDIDLTDYDDVRNSSSGAAMSKECWSLMHAAIQVRLLAHL